MPYPFVAVIGSTGTGKSSAAVAIGLAVRDRIPDVTPHIINADVSQMYAGLPIATNKPDVLADTGGLPHHFFGHLDSSTSMTAAAFVTALEQLVAEIRHAEQSPLFILCGGTHYYVQCALIRGEMLTEVEVRQTRRTDGSADDRWGGQRPWDVLHKIDPMAAARWHPNDEQRIVRMIDVFEATGELPSSLMEQHWRHPPSLRKSVVGEAAPPPVVIVVECQSRAVLEERINSRVDAMLQRGLLDEVSRFYCSGSSKAAPLERAIGYKEFIPALDAAAAVTGNSSPTLELGDPLVAEAVRQVKLNTRRYALQQQQWIRNRFIGKYSPILLPHFYVVQSGAQCDAAAANTVLAVVVLKQDGPSPLDVAAGIVRRIAAADVPLAPKDMTTSRCDTCDVILCGKEQTEAHANSNSHRRRLRRESLRQERQSPAQPSPVTKLDTKHVAR